MPAAKKTVFEWDDANRGHIARHHIAQKEAEQVIAGGSLPIESEERSGEAQYTELGETAKGRLLVVVWTWRAGKVRVVTAFPANRKWQALWRRIKQGEPDA